MTSQIKNIPESRIGSGMAIAIVFHIIHTISMLSES